MTDTVALTNGTARRAAAARYTAAVDAGVPLTGRELAAEFGRSESWGRDVIRGTREVGVAAAPNATAPTGQRHSWQTLLGALVAAAASYGVTLIVALVAAAASYGHMLHVAHVAGEPMWIARAWPITVDGLVVAALRRGEPGRPWLLLGLAVSVASNVLAQYPATIEQVAPAIAAWPPLALYGTHRLLHRG